VDPEMPVSMVEVCTGVSAYFPAESSAKYHVKEAADEMVFMATRTLSIKHLAGTFLEFASLDVSAVKAMAA
jgi:hypothetical protein